VVDSEVVGGFLADALMDLADSKDYEIGFELVESREGLVSELARVTRVRDRVVYLDGSAVVKKYVMLGSRGQCS